MKVPLDSATVSSTPLSVSSSVSSLEEKEFEDSNIGNSLPYRKDTSATDANDCHNHENKLNDSAEKESSSTKELSDDHGDERYQSSAAPLEPSEVTPTSRSMVRIGGPGTILPRFVESLLAWGLALSCLSVACWYYYLDGVMCAANTTFGRSSSVSEREDPLFAMPLMTHCPRELMSVATVKGLQRRYAQLQQWILQYLPDFPLKGDDSCCSEQLDSMLLRFVHSNEVARRLVSLIMLQRHRRSYIWQEFRSKMKTQQGRGEGTHENATLVLTLERIWSKLVSLPVTCSDTGKKVQFAFEISVIVPLYRENGRNFLALLVSWMETAEDADKIEIIAVDAGECIHMDEVDDMIKQQSTTKNSWKNISILRFSDGGGRGPCLNYGARHAKGRILTFLHADTKLSRHWDSEVQSALDPGIASDVVSTETKSVTTFCAFSFAIDKSSESSGTIPPGLRAIETTANWRCKLFNLPYGDQCLSIPRYVFDFVGGYPDQCLMEDYEIVRLLRERSRISQRNDVTIGASVRSLPSMKERFQLLQKNAYCSPRRWQSLGVIKVTATNSRIVQQYNTAVNCDAGNSNSMSNDKTCSLFELHSPDEQLFCQYYGTSDPPKRSYPHHSPWELQLIQQDLD